MKFKRHALILLFSVGATLCFAQEFSITKVEVTRESVVLHYSVIDTTRARLYSINLYSSRDNFIRPLQDVSGDIGIEVKPGTNKKIVWNSRKELGDSFAGDVELEIRGRVYIPFIRFDGFQDGLVIKRGKPRTITWTGGSRQNILNFELYKNDTYVEVIPNVANSGSYDLELPTSVKPGNGYYFLVSDTKNKDQVVKTNLFKVKRKVPLAVKVLPVLAVGAAIPFLSGPDGADEVGVPPGPPETKN